MSDSVMVRAYADEPVRLTAIDVNTQYVLVIGRDSAKPIGFPPARVFRLDNELFEKLRRLYEIGDKITLTALWERAIRY